MPASRRPCFGYRACPTKLVIGYADSSYHSWNEVYVNGQWMRLDITAQVTNMNVKSYTTERIY